MIGYLDIEDWELMEASVEYLAGVPTECSSHWDSKQNRQILKRIKKLAGQLDASEPDERELLQQLVSVKNSIRTSQNREKKKRRKHSKGGEL